MLIQVGGRNVLTDPIWSGRASPVTWAGPVRWVPPPLRLEDLPPLDLVLLSHNHYDHFDDWTIRQLARLHPEAHWAVPLGLAEAVRRRGVQKVEELDWWDEREVAGLRIGCTPAQHFSSRTPWDRNRSLWCGWTLTADRRTAGPPVRTYFAGDTGYFPEFPAIGRRFGPFDLALIPIGAYDPRWFMKPVHMNPEEAVRAAIELSRTAGPSDRRTEPEGWGQTGGPESGFGPPVRRSAGPTVVPIHWGTFKLTDEPMDEPPKRFRAAWVAAGLPEERLRNLRHGETAQV